MNAGSYRTSSYQWIFSILAFFVLAACSPHEEHLEKEESHPYQSAGEYKGAYIHESPLTISPYSGDLYEKPAGKKEYRGGYYPGGPVYVVPQDE